MTTERVYKVQKGDCAWNFAKANLTARQDKVTNADIVKEMNRLAKLYGCEDVNDYNNKYFSKCDYEFEIKDKQPDITPSPRASYKPAHRTDIQSSMIVPVDTICPIDAIGESINVRKDILTMNNQFARRPIADLEKELHSTEWNEYKEKQEKINNLSTDKEKVIAWNKQFNQSKDNYVIIDKKNFTATVYTSDGQVVKEYEIACARNKSDALLRRSYKTNENSFASTSAGIYTANYRATGEDAYSRLYNDRVLTLSNDGLKARGVGNGETGVAFHQVPNGNTHRMNLMKKPGATTENNRTTDGCVNFLPEDFDDCMNHIDGVGTKVYILPEDSNNYMCVKNGQLHFAQKKYTGDVATTSTANDPVKKINITVNDKSLRKEAAEMAQTLAEQKENLIKDLRLDNDSFNDIAGVALGIAGVETKYGDPLANFRNGPYWIKENLSFAVDSLKQVKGIQSFNSRGLTQMKLGTYTDKNVKELLEKYNITEDNLHQGDKCAIATMIVLSGIYKNELPALKSNMQELNLSKTDALLYCWNGKKYEIKNKTATPEQNLYIQGVNKYMKKFDITQYA